MKLNFYSILCTIVMMCLSISIGAQEERKSSETKVIMIKKNQADIGGQKVDVSVEDVNGVRQFHVLIHDEDGKVTEYKWEGDEVPPEVKTQMGDLDINVFHLDEKDGDITIQIDEDAEGVNVEKHHKVIIRTELDSGEEQLIEWEGEGDMPSEIREKIDMLHESHDLDQGENLTILRERDEFGEMDKERSIQIRRKDGTTYEWNGKGPIPDHIRKELDAINPSEIESMTVSKGKPNRAFLGIQLGIEAEVTVENGEETRTETLKVVGTIPGSGAEDAGLKEGDILRQINDIDISSHDNLTDALAPLEPGEVVKVMIERDDEMIVLDVTLGEHPEINENKVIEKHIEIIVERDGTEESPDLSIDLPKLQLNQFEAYPNPNKGLLTVKFRGEAEPTVITISDIAGKSVYKEALSTFDGNYNKEISLSKFAKGTLLLIIEQGGKRFTEKIVHQ